MKAHAQSCQIVDSNEEKIPEEKNRNNEMEKTSTLDLTMNTLSHELLDVAHTIILTSMDCSDFCLHLLLYTQTFFKWYNSSRKFYMNQIVDCLGRKWHRMGIYLCRWDNSHFIIFMRNDHTSLRLKIKMLLASHLNFPFYDMITASIWKCLLHISTFNCMTPSLYDRIKFKISCNKLLLRYTFRQF